VTERIDYRCLGCGSVTTLDSKYGILTLRATDTDPRKPPAPTCIACSGRSWVQVGSMTEYYQWRRREDVCVVGNHVGGPNVRQYELRPRVRVAPEPGKLALESLSVRACDDHVGQLEEHGLHGFYLERAKQ
jgi:hypothetical protein